MSDSTRQSAADDATLGSSAEKATGRQQSSSGAASTVLSDRFELGPVIAQTESGTVFQAHDRLADKHVAVKVLAAVANAREYNQKVAQRQRLAARLTHPNIITATDVGECDDRRTFFASPYVPGASVYDEIAEKGPLSSERAIAMCLQVCKAFDHAHSKSVSHKLSARDIVLIKTERERDFVKLVGFGMSKENIDATVADELATVEDVYSIATMTATRGPLAADEILDDLKHIALAMKAMAFGLPGQKGRAGSSDRAMDSRFKQIITAILSEKGPTYYKSVSDLQHDLEILLSKSDEDWDNRAIMRSRVLDAQRKRTFRIAIAVSVLAVLVIGGVWLTLVIPKMNQTEYGESPAMLWPVIAPKPGASAGEPKTWSQAGDFAEVIKFADQGAQKDDLESVSGALSQYLSAAAKALKPGQTAALKGRLAAAQLRLGKNQEARSAADAAMNDLNSTDDSGIVGTLDTAGTLAFLGQTTSLTPEEERFLTQVQNDGLVIHEGQKKHSDRLGLFLSRLGDLYRSKKQYEQAEKAYLAADQCWRGSIYHHDDLIKGLFGLAQTYEAEGNATKTKSAYEKALAQTKIGQVRQSLGSLVRSSYASYLWNQDPVKSVSTRLGIN